MATIVESARAAIAQEFQIAERLDAKARNQVAVGGAWYAAVQAVSAIAIKQHLDSAKGAGLAAKHHVTSGFGNDWFLVLIIVAGIAGVLLAVTIYFSYGVWKLRDEHEISSESLSQMAASARDPDTDLLGAFVEHYGYILSTRRENNGKRSKSFKWSSRFWSLALLSGLVELVFALVLLAYS
jgi:hypothetical protein